MHKNSRIYALQFTNTLKQFPIEKLNSETLNRRPHQIYNYLFSEVQTAELEDPILVSVNKKGLELLDIEKNYKLDEQDIEVLAGNRNAQNGYQLAQCYHGYQFGSFAGQLGDGRAISLGDYRNSRNELWDIQLKGSGLTPYSRHADGRAVLRSSVREYLASEFNYHLMIPTSRALALVMSKQTKVLRDKLYDNNAKYEDCAICVRMINSWFRIGTLQNYIQKGNQKDSREQMVPQIIKYLYDQSILKNKEYTDYQELEEQFYNESIDMNGYLFGMWMCYGFIHGVLNTDNMSLIGQTIDYGPYQYMEYYDAEQISNHSDDKGRYSYSNQPNIGEWNMEKLKEALLYGSSYQNTFKQVYQMYFYKMMAVKLGIVQSMSMDVQSIKSIKYQYLVQNNVINLIDQLVSTFEQTGADFTNTFRLLARLQRNKDYKQIVEQIIGVCMNVAYKTVKDGCPNELQQQLNKLQFIKQTQPQILQMYGISDSVLQTMNDKLDRMKSNSSLDDQSLISNNEQQWTTFIQKYLEMLEQLDINDQQRMQQMNKVNPWFQLRNYILEQCISQCEQQQFGMLEELLEICQNPFDEGLFGEQKVKQYSKVVQQKDYEIKVSCSS